MWSSGFPRQRRGGRNFDLRVVTFAGKACHTVVRTSRSPLTNLHLGNRRGDLSLVRQAAGSRWNLVSDLCEQAARALPDALYVGWDVLVTPGFRRGGHTGRKCVWRLASQSDA